LPRQGGLWNDAAVIFLPLLRPPAGPLPTLASP
jgi:hypothetical protein